jgi:hypothetical protein
MLRSSRNKRRRDKMAAVPVTFQGILFFSDVGVGGGPMPGGPPLGIWPSPGHPAHPIAPGGPPPGYWGGVAPPLPTHPIAPGGAPPGYWGGVAPPYPDQGLPGQPPGYWGGVAPPLPTHPIVLPPYQPGGPPVTIWPSPGNPSHPIVIPPPPPPPTEGGKPPPEGEGGWGYHPDYGWGYFPVGTPGPKKV